MSEHARVLQTNSETTDNSVANAGKLGNLLLPGAEEWVADSLQGVLRSPISTAQPIFSMQDNVYSWLALHGAQTT